MHNRTRIDSEQAIQLLGEWCREQRPLAVLYVIGGKFRTLFEGGDLRELREGAGLFYYETEGAMHLLFPQEFEQHDREETDFLERLIFGDSNWSNIIQVIRTKDNEPLPIETLSEWIN